MGMFNPERNIDGIIDNGDIDGVTKDNHGGTSPTLAREESDEDLLDSPDLDELWEEPSPTLARKVDYEDTVRLLLEKGADVNAKDKTGENAFDYAQDKAIVDVLKEGQTKHGPSHLKESLSDLAEKDNRESDASYTLSEEYARGNNVSFSVSNAALVRNKGR